MDQVAALHNLRYSPDGDGAVRVEFGHAVDPRINRRVHGFCAALSDADIDGVIEFVAAYAVATVYYDPATVEYDALVDRLRELVHPDLEVPSTRSTIVEVPVVYGGDFGPDLARVAQARGLTIDMAIAMHSRRDYLCYMIGFMPGFPYLGELPVELRTPRLETPRTRVPAGSVAIADAQTGIYPRETPGGWNIIGRTPLRLFDPSTDIPSVIRPGDTVRFVPIDAVEYARLSEKE